MKSHYPDEFCTFVMRIRMVVRIRSMKIVRIRTDTH